MKEALEVVRDWHDAVNRGDADALIAVSKEEIEIGGPRGTARGSAVQRDWIERAGIHLEPRRWFAGADIVVVEQVATWRSAEDSATEPVTIASSFRIEKGLVSKMVRFESLPDALDATGLAVHDEVPYIAS